MNVGVHECVGFGGGSLYLQGCSGQGVGWRQGDLLVEQAELEGHVNGVK